jgi:hypothetical protein
VTARMPDDQAAADSGAPLLRFDDSPISAM